MHECRVHCCTLLSLRALVSTVQQVYWSCDSLSCAGVNARRPEGSKEADFDAPPTQFHTSMQKLFPVLLSLACAAESVARQLFEPLIMSLVHWLTRSARRSVHRPSNTRPASGMPCAVCAMPSCMCLFCITNKITEELAGIFMYNNAVSLPELRFGNMTQAVLAWYYILS